MISTYACVATPTGDSRMKKAGGGGSTYFRRVRGACWSETTSSGQRIPTYVCVVTPTGIALFPSWQLGCLWLLLNTQVVKSLL